MNALKIVRLLGLAVAVIGAFAAIPQAALMMAVLGLAAGVMGDMEDSSDRTGRLVAAAVLISVAGAAGPIPVVGEHISAIMGNVSIILSASALGIIIMMIKEKVS
ncbi:hypothetical protein N9N16_01495 [Porticoccaceae bacterium]|nr:hypothetical protein [Porticoccaceae bacterium]